MNPIAEILAATDFSTCAEKAVHRAARLAQEHQARLHLVHVMDRLLLRVFARTLDEHPLATEQQLLVATRSQLGELAAQVAKDFGIAVRHELLIGRIHECAAEYAQAHAVALSLFGAHGENFVRDVFVGSTAGKYLRRGRQPTLVVRSDAPHSYQHVLVAVDFSPASRLALQWAARIAPQAHVHVLHISELPFEGKMRFAGVPDDEITQYRRNAEHESRRNLETFLGEIAGTESMSRSVLSGPPSHAIVTQAQARQADLVVMGKRGKLELDEFLLGSVTLRVLEELDRDLLLVAPART